MGEKSKDVLCSKEQCIHYLEKNKLHFYRKKFMWIVIIFSFASACVLGWLVYHHDKQLNIIVGQHKRYVNAQNEFLQDVKVNKSTIYVNDNVLHAVKTETKTIENLLQIQTTHQHAQFTLLSVWAGVLMIVFLVFSLYSMFKTDELVKQARDSINTIGNSKAEVDNKLQEVDAKVAVEVEQIKAELNIYLAEIKKDLEKEQFKVSENIKQKGDEFSQTFSEYGKKLEEAQKTLDGIFKGIEVVVNAVRSTGTSNEELGTHRQETK